MTTSFNRFATQGNQFVAHLAYELETPHETRRAYHILKAVLQGIRNRITPEESSHVLSQLPMSLKSLYVDGWQIGKKYNRVDSMSEFVDEVYQLSGGCKTRIFNCKTEVEKAIHAVFNVLGKYISDGEFEDILMCMPAALRVHLMDYVMEGHALIM